MLEIWSSKRFLSVGNKRLPFSIFWELKERQTVVLFPRVSAVDCGAKLCTSSHGGCSVLTAFENDVLAA